MTSVGVDEPLYPERMNCLPKTHYGPCDLPICDEAYGYVQQLIAGGERPAGERLNGQDEWRRESMPGYFEIHKTGQKT